MSIALLTTIGYESNTLAPLLCVAAHSGSRRQLCPRLSESGFSVSGWWRYIATIRVGISFSVCNDKRIHSYLRGQFRDGE